MPKLTRHRPPAIAYLRELSLGKEITADIMHLTPKDEDRLLVTVGSAHSREIVSRPAAFPSISQSNPLCDTASMHEKALQRDHSVEWIGR